LQHGREGSVVTLCKKDDCSRVLKSSNVDRFESWTQLDISEGEAASAAAEIGVGPPVHAFGICGSGKPGTAIEQHVVMDKLNGMTLETKLHGLMLEEKVDKA